MFFFYTSHLKLSPELIGTKQFIDGIAALGGGYWCQLASACVHWVVTVQHCIWPDE